MIMKQYAAYLAVKQLLLGLSCPYQNVYYNDIDGNKENCMTVYVRGGIAPRARRLGDATYTKRLLRIQLLIQTGRDKASIMGGQYFGEQIEDEFPTVFNRDITLDSTKIGYDANSKLTNVAKNIVKTAVFRFVRTDPQSGLINAGKTGQGLTRYSINYSIEYDIFEGTALTPQQSVTP